MDKSNQAKKLYLLLQRKVMGGCVSDSDTMPNSQGQKRSPELSSEQRASLVSNKFEIVHKISSILSKMCYTQNSLMSLAKIVCDSVVNMEQMESTEDAMLVDQLFDPDTKAQINAGKMFYKDILKKIESMKGKEVKQFYKSRIYHKISNQLSGSMEFHQQQASSGLSSKKTTYINKFDIECREGSNYYKLSQRQMMITVMLEVIGEEVKKLGEKSKFTISSIEKESTNFINFVNNCLKKYQEELMLLNFDLSDKEVFKIGEIARDACNYYDNGVFLLFHYLVMSIRNLEKKGKKIEEIEKLAQDAIGNITKKYPPGEGLSGDKKYIEPQLKKLEMKAKFQHKSQELNSANKSQELKNIIIEKAKVAERNKGYFQKLLQTACLKHCVSYKAGLKYYPNNPNPKAITRIEEKMLFKGKDIKRQPQLTVQGVLESQEEAYKRNLEESLANLTNITFSISDMVRGKCIFVSVEDIVSAILDIKEFIEEENSKGGAQYRLTEIESRFTNKIPISDVTLKIAINEEIVAELQLTLQTNAAAYNFAHKVYELARSKMFSKIKISHNYFQEFRGDFEDMTKRIITTNNSNVDPSFLKNFFSIKDLSLLSLGQAVVKNYLKLNYQITPKHSINPLFQKLIMLVFDSHMGAEMNDLGKILKMLLQMEKQMDIEFDNCLIFFFYCYLDSKFIEVNLKMRDNKYLLQQWGLLEHGSLLGDKFITSRQFYHGKMYQSILSGKEDVHYINLIYGENSQETLNILLQFMELYVHDKNLKSFKRRYNWFMSIADLMPNMKNSMLTTNTKFLMAKIHFEFEEFKKAKPLFEEVKLVYKSKDIFSKVFECDFYLIGISVNEQKDMKITDFIKAYDKHLEMGKVMGVLLHGQQIGTVEWIVGQMLWKKDESFKKRALDLHLRKGYIERIPKLKIDDAVELMQKYWEQYEVFKLPCPQITNFPDNYDTKTDITLEDQTCIRLKIFFVLPHPHLQSIYITRQYEKPYFQALEYMKYAKFASLKSLVIKYGQFGCKYCKFIGECNFPQLKQLILNQCGIGNQGAEYLSKGKWPKLQNLELQENRDIDGKGVEFLASANWPLLTKYPMKYLRDNAVDAFLKSKWAKSLTSLNLELSDTGLQKLSKSSLSSINFLYIDEKTTNKSCELISKIQLPNLIQIKFIEKCQITDEGYTALSHCRWPKLERFYAKPMEPNDNQAIIVSRAQWPKLEQIEFNWDSIKNEDKMKNSFMQRGLSFAGWY